SASVAGALLCLALLFPAWFVLGSLVRGTGLGVQLPLQALLTLLLFVLVPLLASAWGRGRVGPAFNLRAARWLAYPAAAALGLALCPLMYELLVLLRDAGLTFLPRGQEGTLRAYVGTWRSAPAALVVGSLALAGALEELFFRGYLFTALRRVTGAGNA